MNHVKRAIIMAAGVGERMRPVTLETPKPLVRVCGERMIDSIISALHENGIFEIHVVVGYLKEQFAALPAQYPGLTLVENPDYRAANNISSLYYARKYLGSCIILDGDQLIRDPEILRPEFERSGYLCRWTDRPTREWVLTVEDGAVTGCSTRGGERGWELHSVSLWSEEDGRRLREYVEYEYEVRENRAIYWDEVALLCHPEDFSLGIRPMEPEALMEIDSMEELAAVDAAYRKELGD